MLAGGGGLLQGLDVRIAHETGMPVMIAPYPLDAVALGSGQSLEMYDAYGEVLQAHIFD